MKILKTILFSIYPIIIVFLLLLNIKNRNFNKPSPISENPIEEPIDTIDTIKNAEKIGKNGALKVTLLWDFEGDIDLHVKQPNGKEIYYNFKTDLTTGGALDVDNEDGGKGSAENIYWDEPSTGDYLVKLVYYKASKISGVAGTGTCKVVVFQKGKKTKTYKIVMSQVKETKNVATIKIP